MRRALLIGAFSLFLFVGRARADELPTEVSWEQLAALVREADPSVLIAGAEARAVAAQVAVSRSLPNPEVSYLGYARTRGNSAAINGSQHQAQVEQPVLLFGQRFARERYATKLAEVAEAQVQLARLDALRVARHAFVSLLAAKASVEVVEAAERRLAAALHVVTERARAGAQSAYDVLRVEVEHAQLLARLEQRRVEERAASAAIANELGKPGWAPRAAGSLAAPTEVTIPGWDKVEQTHPLAQAFERELRAQGAGVELARAERRPIPSVTAGGYWTTDGNSSSVVLGVSLPLPLLNTGRAAIEAATANVRTVEVARDQTLNQARARYEGARSVLESARRGYQMYQQGAVERLPQLRDMAEAAYKAGAANVLVLVDANRSATEIELGRVEVTEALLHAAAEALAAAAAL